MSHQTQPTFFKAGITYIRDEPYRAPELLDVFQCVHVAPNPRNGEPRAFGFAKTASDRREGWYSTVLTPARWEKGWAEYHLEGQTDQPQTAGPDEPARTIADHTNDLGDWCPWSKTTVSAAYDDDRCPAGCRASHIEENNAHG